MKKLMILFLICFALPTAAFAKCGGDDIGTDFWGRTYGCACSGGGVQEQKSRGNIIISVNPGKVLKCTGCGFFCNDKWSELNGGWCPNNPDTKTNNQLVTIMDEARRCWARRCPTGSYFPGKSDGTIDYATCAPCNGISQRVSDGICWDVECGAGSGDTNPATKDLPFGTQAVIYNGKCMPVCNVKTAGAVYDTSDSTYIKIKIDGVNAGGVGQ